MVDPRYLESASARSHKSSQAEFSARGKSIRSGSLWDCRIDERAPTRAYTSGMSQEDQQGGSDQDVPEVLVVEIEDVLDLHTFAPRDVPALVRDYIDECLERRFPRVRIIHGKGIGNLRRTVHAVLARHPGVASFALADERAGSWGATLVELKLP